MLFRSAIDPLVSDGMLEITDDKRLRATRDGMMVLDAVVADLAR